jgi:hypothetical protein
MTVTPARLAALALGAVAMTATINDAAAQTALSANADASAALFQGVRFRNFMSSGAGGAAEVQVFPSPWSTPGTDYTLGQNLWAAANSISVIYDPGLGTLATKVVNLSNPSGVTTTRNVGALGNLNYIEITVGKSGSTNAIGLTSISLNGGSSLGNAVVNSAPNSKKWKITGANLTSGFRLTAMLTSTGLSGAGDSNHIQVEVGYVAPPDSEGPVTSNVATSPVPALLNGLVTVTADVSDETTGNHNVGTAQYSLNGGIWQTMSAGDGLFNSVNEGVQASFYATKLGLNQICVRGTDSLGNIGVAACENFIVTYKFSGFFAPVENDPAVNSAKAGQSVPIKWRLQDANDAPVTDPTSFVNLLSYAVECTDYSGDPEDTVEEVASGASGLQYLGDGYWQFNWKTASAYANTCRAMVVEFNSTALSPPAKFKFKK